MEPGTEQPRVQLPLHCTTETGLQASLETLLGPLAATAAWQQTLRLLSYGLLPPAVLPQHRTRAGESLGAERAALN